MDLTTSEAVKAMRFAEQIAEHRATTDPVFENHLGEAQAIVLALRSEHRHDVLLIDEMVAREVAARTAVKLSGFPGVLLLAARGGLISAEDLRRRLESCRQQGTHYSSSLIQEVYNMATSDRR